MYLKKTLSTLCHPFRVSFRVLVENQTYHEFSNVLILMSSSQSLKHRHCQNLFFIRILIGCKRCYNFGSYMYWASALDIPSLDDLAFRDENNMHNE